MMARRFLRFELLGRVKAGIAAFVAGSQVQPDEFLPAHGWELGIPDEVPDSGSTRGTVHLCPYVLEGGRIVNTCPRHREKPTET
jgi:hypothetical protein